MNKKMMFAIIVILIFMIIIIVAKFSYKQTDNSVGAKVDYLEENKDEIYVVSTMQDTIKENSAWCGTFQLVWNDMQDNLTKGKVEVDEPNEFIENLNKQKFNEKHLSEESYYKKWGLVNADLKKEIENGIKAKFNENSDILNSIDWNEGYKKYLFYAMLKKEFEFPNEFDILEPSNFKNIENVQYFGIDEDTEYEAREQVEVLYYNGEEDFAVKLQTKTNDEVILARKDNSINFEDMYNNILNKNENFSGSTNFKEGDILKVPNLKIDVFRRFNEVIDKTFLDKDVGTITIDEAIQTIKMELDNKGGKIKSEALIVSKFTSAAPIAIEEPREFIFNDDYVIFLKETDKDLPYFAACINDINLFVDEDTAE